MERCMVCLLLAHIDIELNYFLFENKKQLSTNHGNLLSQFKFNTYEWKDWINNLIFIGKFREIKFIKLETKKSSESIFDGSNTILKIREDQGLFRTKLFSLI